MLKVKSPFDLFVNLELAVLAILLPLDFLRKNQRALSFFSYLSLATLWTYSFLGEKVPWLTIYPQISALIFIVLLFDSRGFFTGEFFSLVKTKSVDRVVALICSAVMIVTTVCILEGLLFGDTGAVSENVLRILGWSLGLLVTFIALKAAQIDVKVPAITFALFIAISLYTSILTNFTHAGEKGELLCQVHTTEEMHQVLLKLGEYLSNPIKTSEPKILVSGSSVWPATWYLRNLPGFQFSANKSEYSSFDYLVVDESDDGVNENFASRQIPLQGWWVPDYSKMRLKTLLNYYFNHEPWSPTGSLFVKFAVPMDASNEEEVQSEPDASEEESADDDSAANDPNNPGDDSDESEETEEVEKTPTASTK